MAKTEADIQEQEQENTQAMSAPAGAAMVPHSGQALAQQPGFDDLGSDIIAGFNAEIETTLKQMSVTEFTGARTLLDETVTLLDAFPFEMQEDSKERIGTKVTVQKVMLVVADSFGEIHYVMQNANPSRERFITLYAKVKAANIVGRTDRKFSLTNLVFKEVGKPIAGNKPIVLSFTPNTEWLESLPA